MRAAVGLRRLLRGNYWDVVYVVDSWTIPVFWLATGGRMRCGKAGVVYHTFEWLDPKPSYAWRRAFERWLCRRADLVVNIDRLRGRTMQALYRLAREPLWIRHQLSRSEPVPPRDPELRQRLLGEGLADTKVLILSPSIAHPERVTMELIQAVAKLPNSFYLATIGGTGDYQGSCERLVRQLGVGGRVRFLPPMPFEEVMRYVASSDVGIALHDGSRSLGNYFGCPLRLSMFAAAGVPVVASAYPGLEADVYRYRLGVCCDPLDPAAIANAITEVADPARAACFDRQGIRRAFEEGLCIESRGPALVRALEEIVRHKRA